MKHSRRLSRRDFLKTSAALGAGLTLSQSLPALARTRRQDDELVMWWWGEQELPGLQAWVDDTVAAYTGAKVSAMLQNTDVVISQFQTAAAANEAPDVQFLWNGIYHMESVWFGYLAPLNGLVDQAVLDRSGATRLSFYQGDQYRIGWYPLPMIWEYNKDVFDAAGLDADNPPKTWDALLDACDKIKTSGVDPIGGGVQDGFWGEWYLGHALAQSLDSPSEALDLFIGDLDFREPKYHEFWVRLEELKTSGFLNDSMSSLELYPGIDLVVTGQLGMSESIGTRVPADNDTLNGRVGVMTMPVFGTGALAGKPILDSQGLGISSQTEQKEQAAAFLEFMHAPEQLAKFWELTHWMPADSTWDSSVIDAPIVQQLWDGWVTSADSIPYIPNLMPAQFWTDAMFVASQEIIAGTMTGEAAGDLAARVVQEWRDFNPDLVENYQKWADDLR
ncbi:MAG: substrate-binding domain-containing protein [Anaerolineae bacterium]|nr:substrate-binding domain-containing protein [Anaerolineae bacterium]